MNRYLARFQFDCFTGTSTGVGGLAVNLQRGISRRDLLDRPREAREHRLDLLDGRSHVARGNDFAFGIQRIGFLAKADGKVIGLGRIEHASGELGRFTSAIGSTPLASGSSVPPWPTLVLGSPAWRRMRLTALTAVVEPRPTGLSRMIQP